ncbi:YqaJ viral recombinase family protein [Citrobacter freundii]|uniref:YqaJ viral recombinase family protein n=1 Tax=Citrobacter freundii TaxID=546 RepID=UPI003A8406BC
MSDIYEVVDVVQGSKEWLEWRKTGVTATCSPILLEEAGATKTPYELYLQYAGLIKAEDLSVIKQVDAGKKLEALARSYCEKEIGQIALPFCVRNKKYPYMIASLDGQFDDGSILEIRIFARANIFLFFSLKPNRQNSVITTGKFSTSC